MVIDLDAAMALRGQARRSDAGVVRFTGRDIAGLVLAGDMYGAPYDLLGLALGARPDRVRAIVARWRLAELAESGRIGPGSGWRVVHLPVRAQHLATLLRQSERCGRPDAVVGAGDDRGVQTSGGHATTSRADEPSGSLRTSRRSAILSFRSATWLTIPIALPWSRSSSMTPST